jgi:hypothetical protein
MIFLALCLTYAGLGSLCLAMPKHFQELICRAPQLRERQVLRVLGWAAQVLALGACIVARGAPVGSVMYLGMLTITGLALVLMLPYKPKWPLYLAPVGTALSLFLLPFSH